MGFYKSNRLTKKKINVRELHGILYSLNIWMLKFDLYYLIFPITSVLEKHGTLESDVEKE